MISSHVSFAAFLHEGLLQMRARCGMTENEDRVQKTKSIENHRPITCMIIFL